MKKFWLTLSIAAGILSSCANKPQQEATLSGLKAENFQTEVKGKKTDLYTLKNKAGMEVCITNFGGRIVSIMVPDKSGKMQDVVLGFDSISNYVNIPSDFGASVGRYANRINKGKFVLDKDTIQLPTNNFGHCLHGGPEGWQYQVYDGKVISDCCVELTRISPDGDANFPGKVTAKVTFTLHGCLSLSAEVRGGEAPTFPAPKLLVPRFSARCTAAALSSAIACWISVATAVCDDGKVSAAAM